MRPARVVVASVALARLAELAWSRVNTKALMRKGAVEHGAAHYPLIVILHAAWLAALWRGSAGARLRLDWGAAYAGLQALRVWTLATLGRRWTTRVLTIPGETPVTGGPYRFMRHPNYVTVAGEIAALPLALGMPRTAFVFSLANAAILALRVSVEDRAWRDARGGVL